MKERILHALIKKHEAIMEESIINIDTYQNAVGIGEHPDIVEAVETQVKKYSEAKEMVDSITDILTGKGYYFDK